MPTTDRQKSTELAKAERTDPWADLDQAFEGFRTRLMDGFGLMPLAGNFPSPYLSGGVMRPARTDVTDTGAAFKIVAEVPGIAKDQLRIRIRGTSVDIRGEASDESESSSGETIHRERSQRGFFRTLQLPEPVRGTDAKAKVENGLLELELPKINPTPQPAEVDIPVR